ncbi:hypothetical protein K501DRAFT_310315 [Backusella circina FSU 941]|nr:hypothetical protein K501DRAFT_310315 [Backusella circina FSU 941]
MCKCEEGNLSPQQETEQLIKVLINLLGLYDCLRENGAELENEAEFRAYNIIIHLSDQNILFQAITLPPVLSKHLRMKLALEFCCLAQRHSEIMKTATRCKLHISVSPHKTVIISFLILSLNHICHLQWHVY